LTSGLRAVYCYTPARRIKSWVTWEAEDEYFTEQTKSTYQKLALAAPFGNGRVHIGYANDNIYLPPETMKPFYADLRDPKKGKAKLITSHGIGGPMFGNGPSAVQRLAKNDLLGPDILISHANFPHSGDAELFAKSGAHLSCTPSTELQMGWPPVGLHPEHYGHSSVGVDCHSWTSASIPTQLNLLLQHARCSRQEQFLHQGQWSLHTGFSVEQAFNLGTIGGAKAVGLEKEIGRIKEGMKADLVVFDKESPTMLAAAEEDPVAAIVLHSSPRDVEMVLVDGVIRKVSGKLLDVEVLPAPDSGMGIFEEQKAISWKNATRAVLESRRSLMEKMSKIDMNLGEQFVMDLFRLNKSALFEG
jgi:Amidohydrolase family